jgi:hypothetical protein
VRRLFWVGVGAATTVAALRKAREVTDRHVPAGARTALGAAAGLSGALQRARTELRTATAQREAELRADLLAGADLTRSRATVDAWRAERAAHRSAAPDAHREERTDEHTGGVPAAGGGRAAGRHGRPGSARAAADGAEPVRPAGGSHRAEPLRPAGSRRAEDPEDGPEGYSFY